MTSNIGTIYQSLQNLMEKLPNIEAIGIGNAGGVLVFRFTWKPGIQAEFQVLPSQLKMSIHDPEFETYLMDRMENYYKVWEVGEE